MRRRLAASLKRHEIYVVAVIISVVFLSAMGVVAWLLQDSMAGSPYEALEGIDLKSIFATAYVRFREDDKTPYLKVELHNGTLWWIKRVEFKFDDIVYVLKDPEAFRPLHLGAVRCALKKRPIRVEQIEYDLKILKAYGYPPAHLQSPRNTKNVAGDSQTPNVTN
ncbi:MAG: hypothetical protein ACLP05_08375 [Candidatus Kryptoniota bacterium]